MCTRNIVVHGVPHACTINTTLIGASPRCPSSASPRCAGCVKSRLLPLTTVKHRPLPFNCRSPSKAHHYRLFSNVLRVKPTTIVLHLMPTIVIFHLMHTSARSPPLSCRSPSEAQKHLLSTTVFSIYPRLSFSVSSPTLSISV